MRIEFLDHSGTYLFIASNSSLLTSYKAWNPETKDNGNAAVVNAIPPSLCKPLVLRGLTILPFIFAVKNISSKAVSTIFVPVLKIYAGKATKLPTGSFLSPFTNSDTNA